jgi:hypothetical protein
VTRAHQRFQLRSRIHLEVEGLDHRPEIALILAHRDDLAALHTLHQHLDVAVGQLQALDDVRHRSHAVDFIGTRLIDRGVMLRGQKNLLVGRQSFFQGPTLESRPTTKGVIMYGKMTTSRMGIMGRRRVSDFSLEVASEISIRGSVSMGMGCKGAWFLRSLHFEPIT